MNAISWDDILGKKIRYGLAVEGETDKKVIEQFLNSVSEWQNWQSLVSIEICGSRKNVLNQLKNQDTRIWGLIDQDEKSNNDIQSLKEDNPHLLILPRWTIENYFIEPDELSAMLPPVYKNKIQLNEIKSYVLDGIKHGTLWHVLHSRDAFQFCRGHEDGYPMAILGNISFDENKISDRLAKWQNSLNAKDILAHYQQKLSEFEQTPAENYTRHIHGKYFFSQIIVEKILNKIVQKSKDAWLNLLIDGIHQCPQDIKDVLAIMMK